MNWFKRERMLAEIMIVALQSIEIINNVPTLKIDFITNAMGEIYFKYLRAHKCPHCGRKSQC